MDRDGSKNDHFGVKDVHQAADALGVVLHHILPEADGVVVAGADGFFQNGVVDFGKVALDQFRNHAEFRFPCKFFADVIRRGESAAERFIAPRETAVAFRPVGIEAEVSDFPGEIFAAPDQLPVADDSAADAGAHGQVEHIFAALSGTEDPLGESGSVGVVVEESLGFECLGEVVADGNVIPPVHVAGGADESFFEIHRRGRVDADGAELLSGDAGLLEKAFPFLDKIRKDFIRFAHPVVHSSRCKNFSVAHCQAGCDFRPADVKSENRKCIAHFFTPFLPFYHQLLFENLLSSK